MNYIVLLIFSLLVFFQQPALCLENFNAEPDGEKIVNAVLADQTAPVFNSSAKSNVVKKKLSAKEIYNDYAQAIVVIKAGNQLGSGVIVNDTGTIITNFHVVANTGEVWVKMYDGGLYQANQLRQIDTNGDFVVLQLNSSRKFPYVALGNSSELSTGEEVFAIGNPFDKEFSISDGIISRKEADSSLDNLFKHIQFTAPISSGSSGGGLFNEYGELVGIVTSQLSPDSAQNINFAIPIDFIKPSFNNEIKEFNDFNIYVLNTINIDKLTDFYKESSNIDSPISYFEEFCKNKDSSIEQKKSAYTLLSYLYFKKFFVTHDSQYLRKAKSSSDKALKLGANSVSLHYISCVNSILADDGYTLDTSLDYLKKNYPEKANELMESEIYKEMVRRKSSVSYKVGTLIGYTVGIAVVLPVYIAWKVLTLIL